MANVHSTLTGLFAAIADAIRSKKGTTEAITADNFPSEIAAIQTGVDTSDATAAAENIEQGFTAYAKGEKITGEKPVQKYEMFYASFLYQYYNSAGCEIPALFETDREGNVKCFGAAAIDNSICYGVYENIWVNKRAEMNSSFKIIPTLANGKLNLKNATNGAVYDTSSYQAYLCFVKEIS